MWRTSLVVQRLRLCPPDTGSPRSVPGRGTRPHELHRESACCNEDLVHPDKQWRINKVCAECLWDFNAFCVISEGSTCFKIAVSHFIISLSLSLCSVAKSCSTLLQLPWTIVHQASLSVGFSGKNTGVGCHFLLQGVFSNQVSNPRLLHWQADSLPLSHLRRITYVIYNYNCNILNLERIVF